MSEVNPKYVALLEEAFEKLSKMDVYRAPAPEKLEIVNVDIIKDSDTETKEDSEGETLEK